MPEAATRVRHVLFAVGVVVVGLVGAWLAIRAFGRDTVTVGAFTVELEANLAGGGTTLALPPLGEIRAKTHDAPLHMSATLTDVDVEQLAADLKDSSTEAIADEIEVQARSHLAPFAGRIVAIGLAGGIAAGALVYRRRWRLVAMSAVTSLLLVGANTALARSTFRSEAFAEPTFVGTLRLAPQLLGSTRGVSERIDAFRANLERIVGGAARAYSALEPQAIGGTGELRVLHISDIHLNPVGLDFAREVANGFDVDVVVDTGDLTSYGTPLEEGIVDEIPRFRRPYVFVRGNHDPEAVGEGVDATRNGRTLENELTKVEGLRIYGAPHPVFTEDAERDDEETLAEGAERVADKIATDVQALDDPLDIVAVHDDRMAAGLAGRVPLVLSGHFHRARAATVDDTLFLRAGTSGGAGVNMFTRPAPVPLSASILYFEKGRRPKLVAYDVIEQSPTSGRLTIQRHLVGDAERVAPTPSATAP